jgi:alanine-synthesizing transaminase
LFSRRLHWDLSPNALSQAVAARRAAGLPITDLTSANPTRAGFTYDAAWLDALRQPAAMTYEPTAQGRRATREAVAAYYGGAIDPDDIFLTASTSEAYAYLFKLLTDPGDEILTPSPSYPLFEFLATLEQVTVEPYPAGTNDITHWRSERTRAVVAVHPNNPTGQATPRALAASCADQGVPLIVDEVFLDYGWHAPLASFAGEAPFVLSGLSKVCALPQMKLGWIVLGGAAPAKRAIAERLELITDTYLSVSAPVQFAAVEWLRGRAAIQRQIRQRISANLDVLAASGLSVQPGAGGWTAVIHAGVPDEEPLALQLLREEGVLVQPGYFYGYPVGQALVLSLLTAGDDFRQGVGCLRKSLAAP